MIDSFPSGGPHWELLAAKCYTDSSAAAYAGCCGGYKDAMLKVRCSRKIVGATSTLSGFSFKTPETLFVKKVCLSKIVWPRCNFKIWLQINLRSRKHRATSRQHEWAWTWSQGCLGKNKNRFRKQISSDSMWPLRYTENLVLKKKTIKVTVIIIAKS